MAPEPLMVSTPSLSSVHVTPVPHSPSATVSADTVIPPKTSAVTKTTISAIGALQIFLFMMILPNTMQTIPAVLHPKSLLQTISVYGSFRNTVSDYVNILESNNFNIQFLVFFLNHLKIPPDRFLHSVILRTGSRLYRQISVRNSLLNTAGYNI